MFIVGIFVFIFMAFKGVAPFGNYSFANTDCFHQMMPLLAVLQDKLKNGESLLYYWNSGGGGEFLSSYFYYIASPINLLVVFFDKSNLNSFISLTIAIRIVFCSGTFGLFVSKCSLFSEKTENDNVWFDVVLSCAYALSNYICAYMYEIMWLDSLVVFPLILLGYDIFVRKNDPLLYVVSLAYSLYCNYYISYMICAFLVLWFIVDRHESFKRFLKNGFRFAIASILAAGIAAVPLIVSFNSLQKTASSSEDIIRHEWFGNIFNVIRQQFVFSNTIITSYNDYDANIYCGFFILILCIFYVFIKQINIGEKIKRLALIVLLLISMNESLLNFAWHGMHKQHGVPNRFSFLLVVLLLVTAKEAYDNLHDDGKTFIVGLSLAWILPFLSYFFVDFNSIFSSLTILVASYVLVLVYSIGLFTIYWGLKNKSKIGRYVFSIVCIIELLLNAFISLGSNLLKTDDIKVFFDSMESVYSYYDSQDKSKFYRSDRSDGMTDNENAYYGMNGLAVFNSTVNRRVPDFLMSMGHHTWKNRVKYTQTTEFINDLMGIKYIYSINGVTSYEGNPNYDKIYDDGVIAYKNNNALPLCFLVNSDILNYKQVSEEKMSENINSFAAQMNNCGDIITEIIPQYELNYSGCSLKYSKGNEIEFEYSENKGERKNIDIDFSIEEEGEYYIDIREYNEDYITLELDGNIINEGIWLTNGFNRLGNLHLGEIVHINISDNEGNSYQKNNETAIVKIFVYRVNHDNLNKYVENNIKYGMNIQEASDSSVTGIIKSTDDKVLFTSIPYDENWHVYVDNTEINKCCIADTFLGVPLTDGEHEVMFKYISKELDIGLFISVISLFLAVIWIYLIRKKLNECDGKDTL